MTKDTRLNEVLSSRLNFYRPLAKLREGKVDWYEIKNQGSNAEIMIYDEIGYLAITAKDFVRDLNNIQSATIDIHLNTPGGEVFDGLAIYNALKSHPASITTYVDGIAASIGSVIAMAGDRVVMAKNASMMIHDGMGMVAGNAQDMQNMMVLLDKTSNNIASIYAEKTMTKPDKWREMMKAETWFSAEEALEAGLADEIAGSNKEIENKWDLSIFNIKKEPKAEEQNLSVEKEETWDKDLFRRAFEEALND